MNFDFTSSGLSAEEISLLQKPEVKDVLAKAVNNRVDAESTVKAKQLAAQLAEAEINAAKADFKAKMDGLNEKLLKAQGQKGEPSGREIELEGAAKQLQQELDKYKQESENLQERLKDLGVTHALNNAINDYNSKSQATSLKPDTAKFIINEAKGRIKEIDGRLVPHDADGKPIITNEGFSSLDAWIGSHLRSEFPSFFNQPSGGGAVGSKTPGSATGKSISRADFDRLPAADKVKAAQTHTITD